MDCCGTLVYERQDVQIFTAYVCVCVCTCTWEIDSSSHFLSWCKCHLWRAAMMNAVMSFPWQAYTHTYIQTLGYKKAYCSLHHTTYSMLHCMIYLSVVTVYCLRKQWQTFITNVGPIWVKVTSNSMRIQLSCSYLISLVFSFCELTKLVQNLWFFMIILLLW